MGTRDLKTTYGSTQLTLALALFFPLAGNGANSSFCSRTADALFDACKAGVEDDSLVEKAICINISDAAKRDECLGELADARTEGDQLCVDQHDGRLDACSLLGEGRYDPSFAPALFDNPKNPTNPNPYFPLEIGNRWDYRSQSQVNTVEVRTRPRRSQA